jgi:DNA-binding NtrC family response regulator
MGYGHGRADVAEDVAVRTVVLASADADLRQRLRQQLTAMRWEVREAAGGAEAMACLEAAQAEALLVDSWLPDLEVGEFAGQMRRRHPGMDLLQIDGGTDESGTRSPRRNELMHALRQVHAASVGPAERPAWFDAPVAVPRISAADRLAPRDERAAAMVEVANRLRVRSGVVESPAVTLPDVIGDSAAMRELARLVRLVAPRSATVLIEGATGSGKELIAKAVHRLSKRSGKPFVVLNCAAIPEALLEAELFGHTRGAFTGAVNSRTGRVEAANGGTLFLDEIGEMPLGLQAKMLRFLESGEIQRVGGNETMQVDVRIVAATHQPLKVRTGERAFRLDLYHRLAVFPVTVPALCERMEDVPVLAAFFLNRLGDELPVKRLSAGALARLMEYDWPGNVRELAHVLERATILAENRLEIAAADVQL